MYLSAIVLEVGEKRDLGLSLDLGGRSGGRGKGGRRKYGLVGCFVDAVGAFCVADCAVGACVEGSG